MSAKRPGIPHRSDADWARSVEERLEDGQTSPVVRMGDWVLSTDPDTGNLIASHIGGGGKTVAVVPPPGVDPDSVDSGFPMVRLARQEPQSVGSKTNATVLWDTVEAQYGDWGLGGSDQVAAINIPEDGEYLVVYKLCWAASATAKGANLMIDGTIVASDNVNWSGTMSNTHYMSDTYSLTAGQAFSATGYNDAASTSFALGPDPISQYAYTTLTLQRIR